MNASKFKLSFILLNDSNSSLEEYLIHNNIPTYRVNYKNKKNIPSAILQTIKILHTLKTDIVHCHLFDACIVGLTSAKILRIKRRIHTRHNATIHHKYHPHAVKYDKYINFLSTDIVAISENVKKILIDLEGVKENKIKLIHHGFKLSEFENITQDRIQKIITKHFKPEPSYPVIGVISRYIHWKGIHYIIPAFKEVVKKYPKAHLVLANADGPYKNEIKKLLLELPEHSYTEINFEEDIFALYKLFNVFVHTPIDKDSEAFGQVYIESMASGIPSVVSLSGIAIDFIENNYNAIVVPFQNSTAIENGIINLLEDDKLKQDIITQGKESITQLFSLDSMILKLEKLYEE
jgi:glycosyltransferase involved in cell wall biosynthesis